VYQTFAKASLGSVRLKKRASQVYCVMRNASYAGRASEPEEPERAPLTLSELRSLGQAKAYPTKSPAFSNVG